MRSALYVDESRSRHTTSLSNVFIQGGCGAWSLGGLATPNYFQVTGVLRTRSRSGGLGWETPRICQLRPWDPSSCWSIGKFVKNGTWELLTEGWPRQQCFLAKSRKRRVHRESRGPDIWRVSLGFSGGHVAAICTVFYRCFFNFVFI